MEALRGRPNVAGGSMSATSVSILGGMKPGLSSCVIDFDSQESGLLKSWEDAPCQDLLTSVCCWMFLLGNRLGVAEKSKYCCPGPGLSTIVGDPRLVASFACAISGLETVDDEAREDELVGRVKGSCTEPDALEFVGR